MDNVGIVGAIKIKLADQIYVDDAKLELGSKYTDNPKITIYAILEKCVGQVIRDYLKKDKGYLKSLLYDLRLGR